jgi:hypothetical protein
LAHNWLFCSNREAFFRVRHHPNDGWLLAVAGVLAPQEVEAVELFGWRFDAAEPVVVRVGAVDG